MGVEREVGRSDTGYDALISYVDEDRRLAERLLVDLRNLGIRVSLDRVDLFEFSATLGDGDGERGRWPALIVLWTPAAIDDAVLLNEVQAFVVHSAEVAEREANVLPVYFGGDVISQAPAVLSGHQGVVLPQLIYEHGISDDDVPDSVRFAWVGALQQVGRALGVAVSEQDAFDLADRHVLPPTVVNEDASWQLDAQRVQLVGRPERGWLVDRRLAIIHAGNGLSVDARVTCGSGQSREAVATPLRLPQRGPFNGLPGFILARLDQSLDDPMLRAPGTPEPGMSVEVWGTDLRRSSSAGEIVSPNDDGTYQLVLKRSEGIEEGSAVWSPGHGQFLGIAVYFGVQGWRLLSVEVLRRLADRAGISASMEPPSAKIHSDGWTIFDDLDYSLYAAALSEFIRHPDTNAPLVIGVQGPWGQGKTSLMRLVQRRLDPGHPDLVRFGKEVVDPVEVSSEVTFGDLRDTLDGKVELTEPRPTSPRTVWFNPWKYQSSEALWAGLASAILGQLPARLPRREREMFWLRLQAKRIDFSAVRATIYRLIVERLLALLVVALLIGIVAAATCVAAGVAAVISALTGVGATVGAGLLSGLVARHQALTQKLEGNYLRYVRQPDYSGKLGFFHYVDEDMRAALELLTPEDAPTVVFIDDLDRCSAGRIGEVLEAINLFLTGEYPNCFFVLGIDAEVVAAAMAKIHEAALGGEDVEHAKRRNLGWRFLDKFIQLSFVMPRLSPQQRSAYLTSLLGLTAELGIGDKETNDAVAKAEQIRTRVTDEDLDPGLASAELGEVRAAAPAAKSSELRRVAEEVIERGAREFRDNDPRMVRSLEGQLTYLTDNPRTIKRAVNLYRFYYFLSWARAASATNLESADVESLAHWTVIAARWPEAVHWLQVHGRATRGVNGDLFSKMDELYPELRAFLDQNPDFNLEHAMDCGLW
jgi:hypothetical protein